MARLTLPQRPVAPLVRQLGHLAQRLPLVVGSHRDRDPAVVAEAAVDALRRDALLAVASPRRRLTDDLRLPSAFRRRGARADSYDPLHLDRVDRAVNPPGRGSDEPPIGAVAATRAELEMIHLAKGIRSVVGPDANLSPQHVD